MIIGVPKELKEGENRVAMTPAGVYELTKAGHTVLVQRGAGAGSGLLDDEYTAAGAELVDDTAEVYARAEMVVKVKEPEPQEFPYLREGQILFTYLHLAAFPELTRRLLEAKVTAIAYETIQLPNGALPLLRPMSEVAGRMAVQVGARLLEKTQGGRGVLLSGVPGVPPADVVIIGAGTVGTSAAIVALGMGAQVTLIDKDVNRLRYLEEILHGNRITVVSNRYNIERAVAYADLVIGAVLVPGARAPRLVTEDMVRQMKEGSVIVDVAIDQGGCVETADRVTSHREPTYVKHGVIHYAVPNMPGAVPRTSTWALTNATLPYIQQVADKGFIKAVQEDPALRKGVNCYAGCVTLDAVAAAHGLEYVELRQLVPGL
ncbi:MAG: alanine dehydrogenase [Limnochordales bacterium]|nr:MAG: alanine dehydrogenase [Bacillota bacterium]